ncbi:uncharacterized protein Dana_GF24288 [Drosophila ananassae]|uniref:Uncharacterized protein n=1 Tax=Drosophila ananassae TaxID=7217 RepID=B3M6W3_DROAN|nr:uncharacterized protein LOC6506921 [Drosophila ananassae]EDV39799.2 uncharacterized protein Dana_GF24288 [Drosophila ananassae]
MLYATCSSAQLAYAFRAVNLFVPELYHSVGIHYTKHGVTLSASFWESRVEYKVVQILEKQTFIFIYICHTNVLTIMLDPISDTPLVLAYAFMSLLVLILCFIMVNVVHKLYRSLNDQATMVVTSPMSTHQQQQQQQQQQQLFLKTSIMEVDAMKTG